METTITTPLKKGESSFAYLPYTPTETQINVINRVWRRFDAMRNERDKSRREFDGRTLEQYVRDSVDQWNGIVPEDIRSYKEDWQSLAVDHLTKGKIKTVVSMVVGSAPYINIIADKEGAQSELAAKKMRKLYDFEWRDQREHYNTYLQVLDACVKGTVVVEEYYEERHKKLKEITYVDEQTGEVSYEEKDVIEGGHGRVRSRIVSLLNFYPNEHHSDIKGDCCVLEFLPIDEFQKKYGKYRYAATVTPGYQWKENSGLDVEFDRISDNPEDIVEILKYYNEVDDEYIIIANGKWINPQTKDGICPLPYNHKRLPFVKMVFEVTDVHHFYGKSFPDITRGEQETINAVLRLMIDREILSLNRPLIVGLGSELSSSKIAPNRTITTTGSVNEVRELQLSGADMGAFNLLNFMVNRSNVNTAIDPTAQGVHSGRKTARESMILDENAKQSAGTFQIFVYKLLFDRAKLRVENFRQFYKLPIGKKPMFTDRGTPMLDEKDEQMFEDEYRSFTDEQPGKRIRKVEIDPEMCEMCYQLRFEEDFYQGRSQIDRRERSGILLGEAKQNPLIDADAATIEFLTSYHYDPSKFYISSQSQAPQLSGNPGELPPAAPDLAQQMASLPGRRPTR